MARETEAKRTRKKKSNDPSRFRGNFGDIDTFERKTPTLKLKQDRKENKYKNNRMWEDYENEY